MIVITVSGLIQSLQDSYNRSYTVKDYYPIDYIKMFIQIDREVFWTWQ